MIEDAVEGCLVRLLRRGDRHLINVLCNALGLVSAPVLVTASAPVHLRALTLRLRMFVRWACLPPGSGSIAGSTQANSWSFNRRPVLPGPTRIFFPATCSNLTDSAVACSWRRGAYQCSPSTSRTDGPQQTTPPVKGAYFFFRNEESHVKIVQKIANDHTTRDNCQHPSQVACPTRTKRKPLLQCKRGCSATCEAKRPGLVREGSQEQWEALNAANSPRNWAASLDHLPPTSAESTTRRALPPAPCSSPHCPLAKSWNRWLNFSLLMLPPAAGSAQCDPWSGRCSSRCFVPVEKGHRGGVDCELGAGEVGQTIHNNLQSSAIHLRLCDVQVPQHHVS